MLVLSRNAGQSIVVDGELVLMVTFVDREAAELVTTLADGTFLKSFVLSPGEHVAVSDRIEVVLIRIKADMARLGVEAPPGTTFERSAG